jgi:CubicO group peptidase (beta-lactamase class C family)
MLKRVMVPMAAFLFFVCGLSSTTADATADAAGSAYWPLDTWRTSTPEEQGMDSAAIYEALKTIADENLHVNSMLIVRNGYLVTEGYFYRHRSDDLFPLYSGTKSFLSALVGIALDDGRLQSVQQKTLDILSASDEQRKSDKGRITLEHMLTMTSGLKPMGGFPLIGSPDGLKTVMELPLIGVPGQAFQYSGAAPQLLSAVVQQVTGKSAFDFAKERLFGPLGIEKAEWSSDKKGMSIGGTGLSLSSRDMAKFGYLFLQKGIWDQRRIVSEKWIENATAKHVESKPMNAAEDFGCGYLWWINSFGGYSAHGSGGQYIIVVPRENLVVVFTSELDMKNFPRPYELTEKYILKSIRSALSLPANAAMNASVDALVKKLAEKS